MPIANVLLICRCIWAAGEVACKLVVSCIIAIILAAMLRGSILEYVRYTQRTGFCRGVL